MDLRRPLSGAYTGRGTLSGLLKVHVLPTTRIVDVRQGRGRHDHWLVLRCGRRGERPGERPAV
jgi:hypothetical protein